MFDNIQLICELTWGNQCNILYRLKSDRWLVNTTKIKLVHICTLQLINQKFNNQIHLIVKMMGYQPTTVVNRFLPASQSYKMLSYCRETALKGALYFSPKVEDWNCETIFYGHYRSIFNHYDIIGLKICWILWKKTQNKGYYGVQGQRGRYQSKAHMRIPISD